jgi:hypothetical protein
MNHYQSLISKNGFNWQNYNLLIDKLLYSEASLEVKHRIVSRFNPIGWEPILDLAMIANNLFKICLTNPRSYTLGTVGETSTEGMFTNVGLHKIKLHKFKTAPTSFVLNKKSAELFINKGISYV